MSKFTKHTTSNTTKKPPTQRVRWYSSAIAPLRRSMKILCIGFSFYSNNHFADFSLWHQESHNSVWVTRFVDVAWRLDRLIGEPEPMEAPRPSVFYALFAKWGWCVKENVVGILDWTWKTYILVDRSSWACLNTIWSLLLSGECFKPTF